MELVIVLAGLLGLVLLIVPRLRPRAVDGTRDRRRQRRHDDGDR